MVAVRRRERRSIEDLTPEERELFAETLRERIYATLTLLAVLVVLWQNPDDHRPIGTIGIIAGTVGALWLATIIAARMSYLMVHGKGKLEAKYHDTVRAASGLLMPAVLPVLFVVLAWLHIMSLENALFVGILSLVLSLFFFSLISGRQSANRLSQVILYSVLQMLLGVGVVLLKILVE